MNKIGEAIQQVSSLYSKGVPSDESRLSRRLIYNNLLTVRALYTVQKLNKGKSYNEWDLQPLDCVPMEVYKSTPCGNSLKCPMMKSVDKLPLAISNDDTENITVSDFTGRTQFSRTTFDNHKYIYGNKYGSRKPFYFISDGYLYLINSKLTKAYLTGIWRDPIEVYRLNKKYQEESPCFDNNEVSFYTPADMIESMCEAVANQLIGRFMQSKEDITNDSKDSLLQETR